MALLDMPSVEVPYAMDGCEIGTVMAASAREAWSAYRSSHGNIGLLTFLKRDPHFGSAVDAGQRQLVQLNVRGIQATAKVNLLAAAEAVWQPRVMHLPLEAQPGPIQAWMALQVAVLLIKGEQQGSGGLEPAHAPFTCNVAKAGQFIQRQWQSSPPAVAGPGAPAPSATDLLRALQVEPLIRVHLPDGSDPHAAASRHGSSGGASLDADQLFAHLDVRALQQVARLAEAAAAAAMAAVASATGTAPLPRAVGADASSVASAKPGYGAAPASSAPLGRVDHVRGAPALPLPSTPADCGVRPASGSLEEREELLAAADLVWPAEGGVRVWTRNVLARGIILLTKAGLPYQMTSANAGSAVKKAWSKRPPGYQYPERDMPLPFRPAVEGDLLLPLERVGTGMCVVLQAPGPLLRAAAALALAGQTAPQHVSAPSGEAAPRTSGPASAARQIVVNSLGYQVHPNGTECRGWVETARCMRGSACWHHHQELTDDVAEARDVPTLRLLLRAIAIIWPAASVVAVTSGGILDDTTRALACRAAAQYLARQLAARRWRAPQADVEAAVLQAWSLARDDASFPGPVSLALTGSPFITPVPPRALKVAQPVLELQAAALLKRAGLLLLPAPADAGRSTKRALPVIDDPPASPSSHDGASVTVATSVDPALTAAHLEALRAAARVVWNVHIDPAFIIRFAVATCILELAFSQHASPTDQDLHALLAQTAEAATLLWRELRPGCIGPDGQALPLSLDTVRGGLLDAPYFWVYLHHQTGLWMVQLDAEGMVHHVESLRLSAEIAKVLVPLVLEAPELRGTSALQRLPHRGAALQAVTSTQLRPAVRTAVSSRSADAERQGPGGLASGTGKEEKVATGTEPRSRGAASQWGARGREWQQPQQQQQQEQQQQQYEEASGSLAFGSFEVDELAVPAQQPSKQDGQQTVPGQPLASWQQQQAQDRGQPRSGGLQPLPGAPAVAAAAARREQPLAAHAPPRLAVPADSGSHAACGTHDGTGLTVVPATAGGLSLTASIHRVFAGSAVEVRIKLEVALKLASIVTGAHGAAKLPLSVVTSHIAAEHHEVYVAFTAAMLQKGVIPRLRDVLKRDDHFSLLPLSKTDSLVMLDVAQVLEVAPGLSPTAADGALDPATPAPVEAQWLPPSPASLLSPTLGARDAAAAPPADRWQGPAAASPAPAAVAAAAAAAAAAAPGLRTEEGFGLLLPGSLLFESAVAASAQQYPSRPGKRVCPLFTHKGHCPRGDTCYFDHPFDQLPARLAMRLASQMGVLPGGGAARRGRTTFSSAGAGAGSSGDAGSSSAAPHAPVSVVEPPPLLELVAFDGSGNWPRPGSPPAQPSSAVGSAQDSWRKAPPATGTSAAAAVADASSSSRPAPMAAADSPASSAASPGASTSAVRHDNAGLAALAAAVHPVRPGKKACAFFVAKGECKWGMDCWCDHPVDLITIRSARQKLQRALRSTAGAPLHAPGGSARPAPRERRTAVADAGADAICI